VLVSGPDDVETTYPNYAVFLMARAGVVESCIAIWGPRQGSASGGAGGGGVAVGSAIFMVAAESVGQSGFYRALFALVLGLAVAVALVATRIRCPRADDAATEAGFRAS
jgi:hypothetical protein